jgi:hypothetical protein
MNWRQSFGHGTQGTPESSGGNSGKQFKQSTSTAYVNRMKLNIVLGDVSPDKRGLTDRVMNVL